MDGSLSSVFWQDAPSPRFSQDNKIMGAFLIAYPLAGFLTLFWAFWSHPTGRGALRRSHGTSLFTQLRTTIGIYNVHRSLVSVIITDCLYGVTSIVLGSLFMTYCTSSNDCAVTATVWFLFRALAIINHFLAALMCILYMNNPTQGVKKRWFFLFFFFYSLYFAVLTTLYVLSITFAVILLAVAAFIFALVIIIKSCSPVVAPFTSAQKKLLVVVPMINLLAVYVPGFVVEMMVFGAVWLTWETYLGVLFYASFNIVLDGVLCSLILKLATVVEQQMQQEEQQPAPLAPKPNLYEPQPVPYGQEPTPYGQQPVPYGQQALPDAQ